jgi:uncharacterized membrane protein YozB (DUF420 family)
MAELWRKCATLIKTDPRVLLPLLCSSLAFFWYERFQRFISHSAVNWLLTRQSVLGFQIVPSDGSSYGVQRALALVLPFSLMLRLISFAIYTVGFVVTALVVRSLIFNEKLNLGDVFLNLRRKFGRIMLFALALFFSFAFCLVTFVWAVDEALSNALRDQIGSWSVVCAETILVFVLIAWILVPLSLRLIADAQTGKIRRDQKLRGRIAAVFLGIVSFVLYLGIQHATPWINQAFQSETWIRGYLAWPAISMCIDLPMGLLWVFLALIVFEGFEMPEIPSPS